MYLLIKTCWEKFGTIVIKVNISDCLIVTCVGPQALFMGKHIPDLASTVMACWKHQMAWLWEELYSLNTFGMPLECVDPFLWDEVWPWFLCLEVLRHLSKFAYTYFLPMEVCAWFKWLLLFFLVVPFLGFSRLFCSHLLVLLDGFLLFGS